MNMNNANFSAFKSQFMVYDCLFPNSLSLIIIEPAVILFQSIML